MKLYKFVPAPGKGRRVALTPDPSGTNLPPDGAPWRWIGEVEVTPGQGPLIGASSDDILDAIQQDGVVIWPFRDVSHS
jgi:hypothetical protein